MAKRCGCTHDTGGVCGGHVTLRVAATAAGVELQALIDALA